MITQTLPRGNRSPVASPIEQQPVLLAPVNFIEAHDIADTANLDSVSSRSLRRHAGITDLIVIDHIPLGSRRNHQIPIPRRLGIIFPGHPRLIMEPVAANDVAIGLNLQAIVATMKELVEFHPVVGGEIRGIGFLRTQQKGSPLCRLESCGVIGMGIMDIVRMNPVGPAATHHRH